jgi:pyruvate/2-oxoglutarate dehydrogenase complex dihydrolipoamide dehydrogenase (E3) component
MQRYDAIIIGTGQAGPALAHRLANAGQTVAVVERKFFGGTCVNTGCTPTKTLVASAYAAHMARRAVDFGVKIPCEISVDMKAHIHPTVSEYVPVMASNLKDLR